MVVRGRLAFDDQGRLVEIAEDAADPNNPQPSEIDPVEVDQLIAQSVDAEDLDIGGTDLLTTGDFVGFFPMTSKRDRFSTTSTSYVADGGYAQDPVHWDELPASVDSIQTFLRYFGLDEPIDVRLRNTTDGENVFELTDLTTLEYASRIDQYTPTTTNSFIRLRPEIRADDGDDSARILEYHAQIGASL